MIREEDLLLYHYGEGLSSERRAEISAALDADAELRANWHQLLADLSALSHAPRIAIPATVQSRLSARLAAAATSERRPTNIASRKQGWGWPASLAAYASLALAIGIAIGLGMRSPVDQAEPLPQLTDAPKDSASFERGLRLHLADTELQLVGFAQAEPAARTALIARIVQENRMFARAAERSGEARLARVLRSFEAQLQGMDEQTLDTQGIESRREQLDFELGVMQTKLANDPSKSTLNI